MKPDVVFRPSAITQKGKDGFFMPDFVALGEILIDFMPCRTQDGRIAYSPYVGGAPANVARAVAALGHSSAFVGKVGQDFFGTLCREALAEDGVDIRHLVVDPQHPTTLAFVHLAHNGERSFSFYRTGTADVSLSAQDISPALLHSAKMVHIGSVSLTDEPSASATLHAIHTAKEAGALISYDPNLRPRLWKDMNAARDVIQKPLSCCDILKISAEETAFIAGECEPQKAALALYQRYHIPLILVSMDKDGCCALYHGRFFSEAAFHIQAIDTTGAGDCFFAGILHSVMQYGSHLDDLTDEQVQFTLRFANAMGACAALQMGAGCPNIDSVKQMAASR